jgi:hypothetical protein
MHYEAVLIDADHGCHKHGIGPTPVQAIVVALRKIVKLQCNELQEAQADKLGPIEATQIFMMTGLEDRFYENQKTVREDVNGVQVLVRRDPTKEAIYVPCGFVRPVF